MLRIVTEFVEQRTFLLLCDDIGCACTLAAPMPEGIETDSALNHFIKQASNAGWIVGIGRQLCRGHALKIVDQKRMVEVANGAMAQRFQN